MILEDFGCVCLSWKGFKSVVRSLKHLGPNHGEWSLTPEDQLQLVCLDEAG